MKIGIIGSGIVGQVLGKAFLAEGNEVMLGTRNTSKEEVVKWQEQNAGGLTGTFDETASFGEVIILATGGAVTKDAIKLRTRINNRTRVRSRKTNGPAGKKSFIVPL